MHKSVSFFVPWNNTEELTESIEYMPTPHDFSDTNQILSDSFIDLNILQDDEFLSLPTPVQTFQNLTGIPTSTPHNVDPQPVIETLKLDSTLSPAKTFSIPSLPTSLPMEKIVKCKEFSGYPQENAAKFLSEFESYATLYDLQPGDKRRTAAFHLHLRGPALTWYNSLSESAKQSWASLEILFKERFVHFNWQSSTVMMTTEIFQNIKLSPGQSIEDYYCNLVEKGQILKKPDHEILSKFISGLPEKMAFFVRAGQPTDIQTAVTSAKMAEACGYRQENDMVHAIKSEPRKTQTSDDKQEIKDLKDQVEKLTSLVSQLNASKPNAQTSQYTPRRQFNPNQQQYNAPRQQQPRQMPRSIECYACHGHGHIQHECNWNGSGQLKSTLTCQLCSQQGHIAKTCKTLSQTQAGNMSNPGDRHGRPEG